MQIDATEQPTPRSAEWLAGWDAGRAQEFKLASQVTRYRSQVDVAQGDAARYRAALENIEAESFEMFAVTVAAGALHPEPEGKKP